GTKHRYRNPEWWKKVSKRFGYTKRLRAVDFRIKKRKRNNGRPPDTAKELLLKRKKKELCQQLNKKQKEKSLQDLAPKHPGHCKVMNGMQTRAGSIHPSS
ncbi:hypothetical protein DXG01_014956, partial [Tephrocybe rancida]